MRLVVITISLSWICGRFIRETYRDMVRTDIKHCFINILIDYLPVGIECRILFSDVLNQFTRSCLPECAKYTACPSNCP